MKTRISVLCIMICLWLVGVGYAQTPTPPVPSLSISPITYDAAQNRYQVPLAITNPALIGWLQVQIINRDTQTVVFGPARYAVMQSLQLPAENLRHEESYILYIEALNTRAEPIIVQAEQYGTLTQTPVATSYPFTHLAPNQIASLQIVAVDFDAQTPAFWVTLQSQINPPAFQYEVWLQNQNTGLRQTIYTLSPSRDNRLQVPVTGVANGTYRIVVNAQDQNRGSLAVAQYDGVTLNIAVNPLAFLGTPAAIIGMVLILAVLIVLFILATRKPEPEFYVGVNMPTPEGPKIAPPTRMRGRANVVFRPLNSFYPEGKMTSSPFTIGRHKTNWVIPHEKVSRHHATIFVSDKQYFIQDANSANGTWVSGTRLMPNQKHPLRSGDVVGLGDVVKFVVEIVD